MPSPRSSSLLSSFLESLVPVSRGSVSTPRVYLTPFTHGVCLRSRSPDTDLRWGTAGKRLGHARGSPRATRSPQKGGHQASEASADPLGHCIWDGPSELPQNRQGSPVLVPQQWHVTGCQLALRRALSWVKQLPSAQGSAWRTDRPEQPASPPGSEGLAPAKAGAGGTSASEMQSQV